MNTFPPGIRLAAELDEMPDYYRQNFHGTLAQIAAALASGFLQPLTRRAFWRKDALRPLVRLVTERNYWLGVAYGHGNRAARRAAAIEAAEHNRWINDMDAAANALDDTPEGIAQREEWAEAFHRRARVIAHEI